MYLYLKIFLKKMLKYVYTFVHSYHLYNQITMISQQPGCHGPWWCVSECIYIQDAVGNPLLSGGSLLPCLAQPDKMCQV